MKGKNRKKVGKKGLSMALAVLMTASLPFMDLRIYAEVLETGTENAASEEPEAEITESEGEYSVDPASENIEMTTAAYMIYTNLGFNDPENWGLSYNRKNNNQITWMQDSGTGDGCIELNKCSSTDMHIDINELGLSSANIVFEQDVYLEDLHPNAVLFYLRDNVTIGSNVIVTLAEISGDNLKIGDQTVGIECGRWNRISAAVDFANSKYDLYLNGLQVFSGMQLSGDMKNPALWRTYIGSDSPTGILRMDNMRVYDGKKPRALGESNTIYANLQFENTQEWGLSWVKTSGNSLNWTEYEETGSGYLLLEKTNTNDICLDINDLNLTSGYVVFEQDIYLGENYPSGSLFYLRDSKTTGSNVIVNLVEIVQGNLKIGDIRVPVGEEQWHRVSAVLDFINSRYDIYLDNILVFEDMGMNNNLKSPSLWRIYMYSGDNAGTIGYDNLRVYDGTEPRDIDAQKPLEKDIFSDEGALAVLNGRTALQPYGNAIFYNNRKEAVSGGIVMEGEEVLVAQAVFEKLFNVSVTVNDAVITVGDQVEFILDKKEMTVGGRNISIEASPRMDSGEMLLPICAYGKNVLPEGCFLDDGHGMYVVDSTAVNAADSRLKDANLYLFFERKNAEELKELLLANNDNNLTVHPRILADMDDFAVLRDEVNTNDYKAAWFAQIRKRADSYLDQPVLEYQINNGRLLDVSNAALQRICDLGMSWQITNEQKYGVRLIAELENISSFRDWHPEHTLDTGTMAMAAAIAYDWGYDIMTEDQRQEIGERLYRLGLVTAHEAYYGTASYDGGQESGENPGGNENPGDNESPGGSEAREGGSSIILWVGLALLSLMGAGFLIIRCKWKKPE